MSERNTRTYRLLYSGQEGVWQDGGSSIASTAEAAIEKFVADNPQVAQTPGAKFVAIAESNFSPVTLEVEQPAPVVKLKPLTEKPKRERATAASGSRSGGDAD